MNLQTATPMQLAAANIAAESTSAWVEWALGAVVMAVAVASLFFWFIAFKRLSQNQELIPYQRSECVLGFIDMIAIFVVWFGAQISVGIGLLVMVGVKDAGTQEELFAKHGVKLLYLSAIFGIASLLVSAAYLLARYRTTNSFGLRFNQLGKQIGYGVVVFTMMFPPMMLLQWLLTQLVEYDHPVLSVLASNPSFVSIFSCWAAAVLAAPFVEEFLFRGVFQHWLERLSVANFKDNQLFLGGTTSLDDSSHLDAQKGQYQNKYRPFADTGYAADVSSELAQDYNPYHVPYTKAASPVEPKSTGGPQFGYWPILVSSLFFALVHLGQGLAPIPLFFLAVGLGYLFRQTGSLIACITVHFLLNFYSMLVFTVMVLLGETP